MKEKIRLALLDSIRTLGSIGIISHVEPDGDGFCASLALQYFLQSQGKESVIIVDEGDLSRYEHLMQGERIEIYNERQQFELLIVLDCNSRDRLGERAALTKSSRSLILIDHHVVEHNPISADLSFIDTSYASVGLMLYEILKEDLVSLPEKDRIKIANCLYTTVLNDTNNFSNANTNTRVFEQSAGISSLGIKVYDLYNSFYQNRPALEMRYLGEVLATIELRLDGKLLFMHSSLKMERANLIDGSSIMSPTRLVQGARDLAAIIYLREIGLNTYKVSLRSKHLNVNRIATKYGGGGHKSASGCQMQGALDDLIQILCDEITSAEEQNSV